MKPAPWLNNRHAQTLISITWRGKIYQATTHNCQKKYIKLKDGDTLVVDSYLQNEPEKFSDILIVPGTEGISDSFYILRFIEKCLMKGFNVHSMNLRGCGKEFYLCKKLYHAGLASDVLEVTKQIVVGKSLFVVGLSVGGHLVVKMAGEYADTLPVHLSGAATLSSPIDFTQIKDWLNCVKPMYKWFLLRKLKANYFRLAKKFPEIYRNFSNKDFNTVDEFYQNIIAPMHGYKDGEEFFHQISSCYVLDNIKLPTLLVWAEDDPVIIPRIQYHRNKETLENNDNITLLSTSCGGHTGFIFRDQDGQISFWAEQKILNFAQECEALSSNIA